MALPRITPRGTPLLHQDPPLEARIVRATSVISGARAYTTKTLNQARPLPKRNLTWTTSGNVIISSTNASVPNKFGVYPPPDVAASADDYKPTPRVNPLRSSDKVRQYAALETKEPHFHNYKRSNVMKQREHYRYHNAWEKAFYGAPAEKEAYRKHIRELLKMQMSDQLQEIKQDKQDCLSESIDTVTHDMECRRQDAADWRKKFEFLKQYRDENKRIMEWQTEQRKIEKQLEDKRDRETLRYNPINWSHSLK